MWIFAAGRAVNMTQVVAIRFQVKNGDQVAYLDLPNGAALTVTDAAQVAKLSKYYQENSYE